MLVFYDHNCIIFPRLQLMHSHDGASGGRSNVVDQLFSENGIIHRLHRTTIVTLSPPEFGKALLNRRASAQDSQKTHEVGNF